MKQIVDDCTLLIYRSDKNTLIILSCSSICHIFIDLFFKFVLYQAMKFIGFMAGKKCQKQKISIPKSNDKMHETNREGFL